MMGLNPGYFYFTPLQFRQKLKLETPQYAIYSVQASSALVAEQKTGGPRANHSRVFVTGIAQSNPTFNLA